MMTETEPQIESIDVANDDLIDVLAALVDGDDERLVVVGEGPNKMAMPARTNSVVEDTVIYASDLIVDGDVADEIEIEEQSVSINVL